MKLRGFDIDLGIIKNTQIGVSLIQLTFLKTLY